MEKLNLNFSNTQNIIKSICWIIPYISWLLLTINNFASFKWLYNKKYMRIWTIKVVKKYEYLPLQMNYIVIYLVFTFSIILILIGCVYFFIKTLIIKDEEMMRNIMNNYTQYHFFPILCAFFMTILGELNISNEQNFKDIYKAGLSISLFGLVSMIFIYINTNFSKDDWTSNLFIKKGVFSCLIILFWYNFCYDIFHVHAVNTTCNEEINKWMKGCGLAFSIIFGVCNIVFSYIFKDIFYCSMNLLIYIGLVIFFYISDYKYKNNNGDGIVDLFIICISFILIIVLCILNEENRNEELIVTIENLKNESKFNEINDKIKKNRDDIKLIIANINMTPVDED